MRAKLRSGRIRDEVYRQMFRLEGQRPGAERDLAIALLRAWMTLCSEPQGARETMANQDLPDLSSDD
jgi:hypothetical protein